MYELIIAILATYLITILLVETEGPFGVFYKLRKSRVMQEYGVLNCIACTATNISLLTALYVSDDAMTWFMSFLAIAGAVVLLDKVAER